VIDAEIQPLEQSDALVDGAGGPGKRTRPAKPGNSTMNAEAREKIAVAQRSRWARVAKKPMTSAPDHSVPAIRPERWPVLHWPPLCERFW
jgi:hypothetical protein